MFHKKKGPDQPFGHAPDCKIVHADPDLQISWSEIRRGVWEARCVCGSSITMTSSSTIVSGTIR